MATLRRTKGGVVPLAVLDALGDGVTLADERGRIVFSNEAADRILGIPATDSRPEDWSAYYGVFMPDGSGPFPSDQYPLVRALRGEETSGVEMLIRNPSNPAGVRITATGCPMRDENGRIAGASVVFRRVGGGTASLAALRAELQSLRDELQRREGGSALVDRLDAALRLCEAESGR
ncbi:MAG TPA: PAS domain-containing protein [Myxococcales bacterium]|nr:PAS domain-containing protein [Myxococcales bacterium]